MKGHDAEKTNTMNMIESKKKTSWIYIASTGN